MALLPVLGAISFGAGLLGSLTSKTPKYNTSAMRSVLDLISKQEQDINKYFSEALQSYEAQYRNYYANTFGDVASLIAGAGIYESPVSENILNRTRTALMDTYLAGKSELMGQKMQALSSIDQQRINYYMSLANAQYQNQLAKAQKKKSIFGAIGGLGASLFRL
ncbi:MAG TPA: hypothetical protein PKX05_05225 [bacterium]|nr:hypothetical protein [bacterium]